MLVQHPPIYYSDFYACSNLVNDIGLPYDYWDADLGAFQDIGGTIPAVANNDPIGYLISQSGSGHTQLQATSGNRPLLQTAVVNGHGAMLFNGSGQFLNANFTLATDMTIVFAMNPVTWQAFGGVFGDTSGLIGAYQNPSSPTLQVNTGPTTDIRVSTTINTWQIISCRLPLSGTATVRVNNGSDSTAAGSILGGSISGLSLGVIPEEGGAYGNIMLADFYVFSSLLSNPDLSLVAQGFGTYYGLF